MSCITIIPKFSGEKNKSFHYKFLIGKNYYYFTHCTHTEGKFFLGGMAHSPEARRGLSTLINFCIKIGENDYVFGLFCLNNSSMEEDIISDFKTLEEEDITYNNTGRYRHIVGTLSLDEDKYIPTNSGMNKKRALQ